jgi:ATP-dependent Clp protease, protease subunit
MAITIVSFGYRWGSQPRDADWVADVRDIDGDIYRGMENLTGLDAELQALILATGTAEAWVRKYDFDVLTDLDDGDIIAVGCSRGRHRSVAVAQAFARATEAAGYEVLVVNRDIDQPYPGVDSNDGDALDPESNPEPETEETAETEDDRDTTETMGVMNATKSASSRSWYEIRNAAADIAEVYIYDQIGEDWFTGGGVTAKRFVNELADVKAGKIHLHVNSPGGSVFDGVAIFNALQRHPAKVTTYIDGLAASIASVIALAGDQVVMAANSLFMIHNPWGGVQGTAEDMRKMAEVLDKVRETLVNTYEDKTTLTRDELEAALDAETWFTAQEALAAGFIDEVSAPMQVAASFDLAQLPFRHAPKAMADTDSDTAGAVEVGTSDGASEPRKTETFIEGLGFVTL